jgi:hypothetical protein
MPGHRCDRSFLLHCRSHAPFILKLLFPPHFLPLVQSRLPGSRRRVGVEAATVETSPSLLSHFSVCHGSNLLCASPPPPYPSVAGPRPNRCRNVTTRSHCCRLTADPLPPSGEFPPLRPCPTPFPCATSPLWHDLSVGRPPVGCRQPRHLNGRGHGDHEPHARRGLDRVGWIL